MTQRNPMNERYSEENAPKGTTRKSAASAKPKTEAAASVYIEPKVKTKEQRKMIAKANRQKEQAKAKAKGTSVSTDRDGIPYNPPTQRYKNLRRYWWIALAIAIACTIFSFAGQTRLPDYIVYISLACAYVAIIAAFYIDFILIRRERKAYQEKMLQHKPKALRRAEKQAAAERRAAAKAAAANPQPEQPKGLKGLMSKFGGTKDKAVEGANTVVEKQAEEGSITPKKK